MDERGRRRKKERQAGREKERDTQGCKQSAECDLMARPSVFVVHWYLLYLRQETLLTSLRDMNR